ncbi:MAG: formiminotetrahydrofolate cyclodeaminase [Halobacteriales archaeon]|jgi:formiminotetrahydrofolate cyclodeaminase
MEPRFELTPFLERIASRPVAPAGGSAAAAVGAIGASLAEMAALHTERSEETDQRKRVLEARRVLSADRSLLVGLTDADARVVESAFGGSFPNLSGPVRSRLVAVPLAIGEVCLDALSEARALVSIVRGRVTQDLRTTIRLLIGAFRGALETAERNLDLVGGTDHDRLADRVADVAPSAEKVMW